MGGCLQRIGFSNRNSTFWYTGISPAKQKVWKLLSNDQQTNETVYKFEEYEITFIDSQELPTKEINGIVIIFECTQAKQAREMIKKFNKKYPLCVFALGSQDGLLEDQLLLNVEYRDRHRLQHLQLEQIEEKLVQHTLKEFSNLSKKSQTS